jgi:hypothetical protein
MANWACDMSKQTGPNIGVRDLFKGWQLGFSPISRRAARCRAAPSSHRAARCCSGRAAGSLPRPGRAHSGHAREPSRRALPRPGEPVPRGVGEQPRRAGEPPRRVPRPGRARSGHAREPPRRGSAEAGEPPGASPRRAWRAEAAPGKQPRRAGE